MFNVFRGRRGDSEGEPDRFTTCQQNKVIWQRFGCCCARAGNVCLDLGSTPSLGGAGIRKQSLPFCLAKKISSILCAHPPPPAAALLPVPTCNGYVGVDEGQRFSLQHTHEKGWICDIGEFLQHLAAGLSQGNANTWEWELTIPLGAALGTWKPQPRAGCSL